PTESKHQNPRPTPKTQKKKSTLPTSSHGRSGGGLIKPRHKNLISNKNHSCNVRGRFETGCQACSSPEQRLRLYQTERVKASSKPAVDRSKQVRELCCAFPWSRQ